MSTDTAYTSPASWTAAYDEGAAFASVHTRKEAERQCVNSINPLAFMEGFNFHSGDNINDEACEMEEMQSWCND